MAIDNPTIRWRVVATDIKTGSRREISGCINEADAKAIVKMAVMRRGVDEEFLQR